MEGTFSEIEKVVHEEIPKRNDSDSQQFREIEIEFQFVVEKVYGGVVDEQPMTDMPINRAYCMAISGSWLSNVQIRFSK